MKKVKKAQDKVIAPVTSNDFVTGRGARKLTKDQIKHIKRMTYYRATLMRAEMKWSPAEEAAFLNGAMSVFHACRSADQIPAFWIMSQRSILDLLAVWKADGDELF